MEKNAFIQRQIINNIKEIEDTKLLILINSFIRKLISRNNNYSITKLKRIRIEKERSINIVASYIGISVPALKEYEAGIRVPRDEIKIRLANYYNININELF